MKDYIPKKVRIPGEDREVFRSYGYWKNWEPHLKKHEVNSVRDLLLLLYEKRKLSTYRVGELVKISATRISKLLKKFKIKTRPKGGANNPHGARRKPENRGYGRGGSNKYK